jgi:hypothetical protein
MLSTLGTHTMSFRDLATIKEDLGKIAAQCRLLIVLFKAANKAKIERCMELLRNSLSHWDVGHYLL